MNPILRLLQGIAKPIRNRMDDFFSSDPIIYTKENTGNQNVVTTPQPEKQPDYSQMKIKNTYLADRFPEMRQGDVKGASTVRSSAPPPDNGRFYFDFQNDPNIRILPRSSEGEPYPFSQPEGRAREAILKYFPQDATRAAAIANTESGYNWQSTNPHNSAYYGPDTGLFQINQRTFNRYVDKARPDNWVGQYFMENNIPMTNLYDDEFIQAFNDPMVNAAMAKFLMDVQGPSSWFAPGDNAVDLYDNNWFQKRLKAKPYYNEEGELVDPRWRFARGKEESSLQQMYPQYFE